MDNRQTKCLFTISLYGKMLSLANSFSPWQKKNYIPDQDLNKIHSDRKGFSRGSFPFLHFHKHIQYTDLELCLNKQKYY